MKLSISKLLIALNCLVIIFWGSIINRMDYTTIIYMGILIIINAIYSLKYKYARNIYWIEIGYLFLILLWFINGIPIYSSICYFIILVEEVHFFLNMFRARRNNDDCVVNWYDPCDVLFFYNRCFNMVSANFYYFIYYCIV